MSQKTCTSVFTHLKFLQHAGEAFVTWGAWCPRRIDFIFW